jgi:pimeloyl-ACP methyl ester carboxylesterase
MAASGSIWPVRCFAGKPSSYGPLKQIDAGLLNVGYAESGPADGPAVVLLHGWPYDIYSFADVSAILAAKGYRVIVPFLRGYGTTRFLSGETMRNAQQSVVALDVIALMDALKIQTATVSVGGYLISTPEGKAGYAKYTDQFNKFIWHQACNKFSGKYDYRLITGGVGHNLPQEAPQAFAQAIIDAGGLA